jgi:hypothetical protein
MVDEKTSSRPRGISQGLRRLQEVHCPSAPKVAVNLAGLTGRLKSCLFQNHSLDMENTQ